MTHIELITLENAFVFKAVRLAALLDSPWAFGGTYAKESQLSDAEWAARARKWNGEGCAGFLAMDGETVCGIVSATPDDLDATRVAWVEAMWVAPAHRKNGVGRMLIEFIFAWARARGLVSLKLMVTSSNDRAIGFYRRLGFAETGVTEPYPNDPSLIEIEMLRSVA
jgi:ribosomal protein S18 acetylase RimI-like enzyme